MSSTSPESCAKNACGLTDIGRRRAENQDQFLIAELRKSMLVHSTSLLVDKEVPLFGSARGQLLIVADGMGGHAAGRRASSVAMDHLITELLNRMHWFLHLEHDHEDEFIDSLKDLLRQAHARILSEAADDDSQRGMGTTLTMAYIVWPRMYVVHAGDSRCYLIRDGQCEQLTTDHTLARQLVESGGLKPEEEEQSRWSNVLWNVLGGSGDQELIAEVRRTDLVEGDMVLLCSDGLSRYLSTETLAGVVSEGCSDHRGICHRLVGLANAAGGEDNITVVVCSPGPQKISDHALSFRGQNGPELQVQRFDDDDETDLSHLLTEDGLMPEDFADEDTLPG
ncbi:PP2C family protein-serine/threonine phosphatase [Rhodopirellula sallentina]|uniref:Protein serine/threonine phosphatase n=1 Tax=Rhodopirellula sallentina SM41 TaxID=1263870 RepID=M5TZA1_9BACT|nr:protein phosphatase 2C domain-containing protein [Rhodopirellula sallentina]EMI54530.1 protein serine/threonine phosphatase [Rhodopirellula sallentina SM41]